MLEVVQVYREAGKTTAKLLKIKDQPSTVLLPTSQIEPMLEFVEDIELQYDNKIGEFYNLNNLPVYYCQPSLVDHNDDMGSLLANHGKAVNDDARVAHRLATGLVDWTGKTHFI